ncbi:Crp/Fnr family transcriptional regulator, partial [Listeria monocytogenes]|nr:Crp/Fnr family transcriptional regulator [Listeria monocytogenes]
LRIPKCFTKKIIANYSNLSVRSVTHLCRKLVESGFLAENSKSFVLLDKYGRIEPEVTTI